jgi:membrane protein implicated in regulation of membrane protease activity
MRSQHIAAFWKELFWKEIKVTPIKQAAIFELLGGVFGFIWIGASIAAIVLIVMALFFDGSWWHVLYAFGIGVVGKWLLRGFEANKRRVMTQR